MGCPAPSISTYFSSPPAPPHGAAPEQPAAFGLGPQTHHQQDQQLEPQLLGLADVLRALPPDLVRQAIWLRLSRAERAALRLVCRDLNRLAGGSWVRDLQLDIARWSAVTGATTAAAASAASAAAPPPPPPPAPPHGRLHDTFNGPHSVTLRLRIHPWNKDDGARGALRRLSRNVLGSRRPAVPASALGDPSHFSAPVLKYADGAVQNAARGPVPARRFEDRAALDAAIRPAPAAVVNSDGGGGGDGGGELSLFDALGVCRCARVVRMLGLPYDLAIQRPLLESLSMSYPAAEELVIRCTEPCSIHPRLPVATPAAAAQQQQQQQVPLDGFGVAPADATASWPGQAAAAAAAADCAAVRVAVAAVFPGLSRLEVTLMGCQRDSREGACRSPFDDDSAADLPMRAAAALTHLLSVPDLEAPAATVAVAAAAAPSPPLAPPLPRLRSLCLGGMVLTEDLMAAVVRLTGLEELRLRLALPPRGALVAAAVAAGASDGGSAGGGGGGGGGGGRGGSCCVAELPGRLTALRRLRHLSVGLYGFQGRWMGAAVAAGGELRRAEPAAAAVAGAIAVPRLQRWADMFVRPGGATGALASLELPQLSLEGPLLQALQRCPGLTSLSALSLSGDEGRRERSEGQQRRQQQRRPQQQRPEKQSQGPVTWKLRRLKLASVRLGRALLDVLHTAPELRHISLGLSVARYQMEPDRAAAQPAAQQCGGWRSRFDAAAAAGDAVAAAAAAVAVAVAARATAEGAAASGGGGGGGAGPWQELLSLCCGCEGVQMVLCGSLDWVTAVGWLAGALGPKLELLGMQDSSSYGKHSVCDADLAAVVYGMPYLQRLHLLSYSVSTMGLLQLARMPALRDLRFDMGTFLAYIPSSDVLDLAAAFAAARRHGGDGGDGGNAHGGGSDGGPGCIGGRTHNLDGGRCAPFATVDPQPQRPLTITATFLSERQAEQLSAQLTARLAAATASGGGGGGGSIAGASSDAGGAAGGSTVKSTSGDSTGRGMWEGAVGDPWVGTVVRVVADSPDLFEVADEEW